MSEHGSTRTYFQPVGKAGDHDESHLVRVRVEGRVECSVMEQVGLLVVGECFGGGGGGRMG